MIPKQEKEKEEKCPSCLEGFIYHSIDQIPTKSECWNCHGTLMPTYKDEAD